MMSEVGTEKKSDASKDQKIFESYISTKKIVVADTNQSSRAGLAKFLTTLGAKQTNIALCSTFETAQAAILANQPHVVVSDYDLGLRCGIELIQTLKSQHKDLKECLFILVTGNSSQSAVATAAEEDVDTYVLKPFTLEVLKKCLLKAALAKIDPSPYAITIEEGKKLLFDGKIDESMKLFDKAITLDSRPSLAHFYHGQAFLMKKATAEAETDYKSGLALNKIHYKCMVGLFEVLMEKNMHKEAYEVVKKLSRYFPANPQRLAQVLRLAITTKSYDDVERYYQIFTNLDSRNDELIRYICAALVVCGKYYLLSSSNSRALELFKKAAATGGGRVKILREIIMALTEASLGTDAKYFLDRFPPDTQSGVDYLAMEFAVQSITEPATRAISLGRDLISKGHHDLAIYENLIKLSIQENYTAPAKELLEEATRRFPDRKNAFDLLGEKLKVTIQNAPKEKPNQ